MKWARTSASAVRLIITEVATVRRERRLKDRRLVHLQDKDGLREIRFRMIPEIGQPRKVASPDQGNLVRAGVQLRWA